MSAPTFVNLPPPPSNPDTPSEIPGTPTSTTTSLSALSTTAIKDGHRGAPHNNSNLPHHAHSHSSNTLEAERADRISRLAGLERVSTARANPNAANQSLNPQAALQGGGGQIPGYFDANGNPNYTTKISTVGSASATGSAGGGTGGTWDVKSNTDTDMDKDTSETENEGDFGDKMSVVTSEPDRMSVSAMDQSEYGDRDIDGMSDAGASLVGFGEGAGSTVSGPIYTRAAANASQQSPALGKSGLASYVQGASAREGDASPATTTASSAMEQRRDARMVDAVATDSTSSFVDTTVRSPPPVAGVEAAEGILKDRLGEPEKGAAKPLSSPDERGLGKFYFEEKK